MNFNFPISFQVSKPIKYQLPFVSTKTPSDQFNFLCADDATDAVYQWKSIIRIKSKHLQRILYLPNMAKKLIQHPREPKEKKRKAFRKSLILHKTYLIHRGERWPKSLFSMICLSSSSSQSSPSSFR